MRRYTTVWQILIVLVSACVRADTHYVVKDNPGASSPFTTWATAAAGIQDAIDDAACVAGDTVLVSNGVYDNGGGFVYLTNRVCINKAVTVIAASTNPADTVIMGAPDPDTGDCGTNAVRGAYVGSGAVLAGFTITNCYTMTNGHGTRCQSGAGVYFGASDGIVSNCIIAGNKANNSGGGIAGWQYGAGYVYNSTISENRAQGNGAGVIGSALVSHCVISGNVGMAVNSYGGGSYNVTEMNWCLLTHNSAVTGGGGVRSGTLNHCIIANNTCSAGAGSQSATLNNCLIVGNSTTGGDGGGTYAGVVRNCTIYGNSANRGGGVSWMGSNVYNCVVWGNSGAAADIYNNNAANPSALYTCANDAQAFTHGSDGNITNYPMFVDAGVTNLRLMRFSPCVDTGMDMASITNDLDGNPRPIDGHCNGSLKWDMGCYEYVPPPPGTIFMGW